MGWLAGGMVGVCPPLGNHGEGCFDAWGTAGGLCVLGAGFLCFPVFFSSLHTHPLAPFPLLGHVSLHGYLVVSFCLIFCLFLVLFLVIVLTVVVYSVRSVTHFKCRRHYLLTPFCVGFFFSFCCLSLLLFSFVSSHQHSAAVSPPPYRDGDWGYFGPQAQKKISRGEIWAFQADKNKNKKYAGPQRNDCRLSEKITKTHRHYGQQNNPHLLDILRRVLGAKGTC